MINNEAAKIALRNRALSLVVATTGAVTLAQTTAGFTRQVAGTGTVAAVAGVATFSVSQAGVLANGNIVTVAGIQYAVSAFDGTTTCVLSGTPTFSASAFTRAAGSFLTDGFVVGMEVTPAAFGVNGLGVVTAVTATDLSLTGMRVAEVAASGRTLSVGLPALRAYENIPFTPISGRPYIAEEYSPSTLRVKTTPVRLGRTEETGDYFLTWYGVTAVAGIPGVGTAALRKSVDALALLFAPGTDLIAGAHVLTVREDIGPQAGQVIPLTGFAALQLKIPWRAQSRNVVAA